MALACNRLVGHFKRIVGSVGWIAVFSFGLLLLYISTIVPRGIPADADWLLSTLVYSSAVILSLYGAIFTTGALQPRLRCFPQSVHEFCRDVILHIGEK